MGLAECDVISVSQSDYTWEWEIKISRADFRKDFTKQKHENMVNEKNTRTRKGTTIPNYKLL
jgi:hypothetical protein